MIPAGKVRMNSCALTTLQILEHVVFAVAMKMLEPPKHSCMSSFAPSTRPNVKEIV
jgi:hypothetical protein